MIVQCPDCKAKMETADEHTGQMANCPECQAPFELQPVKIEEKKKQADKKAVAKKILTAKPNANSDYKMPILSSIFKVIGYLCIVFFCIALVMTFMQDHSGPYSQSPVVLMITFAIYALFNFGVAQIIEYFAKTAHFAEKISIQLAELAPGPFDDQIKQ